MRAKEKQIELQSYKLEADTIKNNLYPQITFDIPEIIGWKRVNVSPFWAHIPALTNTRYLNALQGIYGLNITQKLPSDTRDNYEAQLLTGKKQLLDAELLSAKKDEAPQLLVKFSAVPDELVFRFSSDYGTSWELLSHNVPWIFHASIGIVWSPDYFSRAAAKSELLKNRSSLIDLQLHELHEQRQHETLLLREKIASVEQAYGLMQQYTAEQASLLKEYRRLYEEHSITESAYEQINAEYALQVYLQAQAFWQLIAAKAEYLFL